MTDSKTNDDWIDKVRLEIYEATKHMSNDEIVEYFKKYREEAAKKYNFLLTRPLDEVDGTESVRI
jgi:hypothetical protein